MPTFLSGLPVHVLVVHAVVVLVPLAVVGSVLIALWPAARRRYGWLVVGVAAVATVSIPVATSTGEGLEHNLPRTAAISIHTHLGDQLLPFAAAMLMLVAGLMLADRIAGGVPWHEKHIAPRSGPGTSATTPAGRAWVRPASLVLAVLTVLFAVVTTVQVVRIGDSGARAAWGGTQYVPQPRSDGDDDGEG